MTNPVFNFSNVQLRNVLYYSILEQRDGHFSSTNQKPTVAQL